MPNPYQCSMKEFYDTTVWEKSNGEMSDTDILSSCTLTPLDRLIVGKTVWYKTAKRLFLEFGLAMIFSLFYICTINPTTWIFTFTLTASFVFLTALISFYITKYLRLSIFLWFLTLAGIGLIWAVNPSNPFYGMLGLTFDYPPFPSRWIAFIPYYIIYLCVECGLLFLRWRWHRSHPISEKDQMILQNEPNWYFLSDDLSIRNVSYLFLFLLFRAMIEEILCRWIIFNVFLSETGNLAIAIIVQAILFGCMHFPDGGWAIVFTSLAGVLLVFFYMYFGAIPATIVHMTWNVFVVIEGYGDKYNITI